MKHLLKNNQKILMEAAIVERLRRSTQFKLHPQLVHASLIYDKYGKRALTSLYQEYIDIAISASEPILICTPTWRANYLRVTSSDIPTSINCDAAKFLIKLKQVQKEKVDIRVGGLIGCKNDCYQPQEGLTVSQAQDFHSWQVEQLASTEIDFLIAETLPNIHEALGIAKTMEASGVPYIISFVISRTGEILDGTSLVDAIEYIDSNTNIKPLGYMINCAYPSFLCPENQPKALFDRLIGYQANASSLDHCDLEGADELKANQVSEWGELMIELNQRYKIKIRGGCCGTEISHLRYMTHSNHKSYS